jgi:hypothetical protein
MNKSFKNNKYTKWYFSIIEKAKRRNDGKERHHIIPRSMGGDDKSSNIVRLSYKEHIVCHLILTKSVKGNKAKRSMLFAARYMIDTRDYKNKSIKFIASLREKSFSERSKMMKGKPSNFNDPRVMYKCHETRRKNGTNPFITNNPMKQKESINKKIDKTSGKNHYSKNKKPYVNLKTGENRYFENSPNDDWIQQHHSKGKPRPKTQGVNKPRSLCSVCSLMIPNHIFKRHANKHENN